MVFLSFLRHGYRRLDNLDGHDAPPYFKRRVRKRYRPPIPPQGTLRNASTFASANHNCQKCTTVAESAGECFPFVQVFYLFDTTPKLLGKPKMSSTSWLPTIFHQLTDEYLESLSRAFFRIGNGMHFRCFNFNAIYSLLSLYSGYFIDPVWTHRLRNKKTPPK